MQSILIIEDEVDLGETYEEKLNSANYNAKLVATIEEAEDLADFHPALLLVDHGLSGSNKNGVEAITTLKKKFPEAALVIFSNYNENSLERKAFELGADEYWVKINFTLKQLIEKIQEILK